MSEDRTLAILCGTMLGMTGITAWVAARPDTRSEYEKCRSDCNNAFGYSSFRDEKLLKCFNQCSRLDLSKFKDNKSTDNKDTTQ